ncbi:XRE family transcriptional regulator [Streptomyces sp. RS10V-4]|uniref:helix-turn-helix domain-containing protein n=1 Tax=Streptomyces rhizoryzae TaxID=2932493 RepID=UPI002005D773|nr:helix-turn-helix domain-containing protein [Streptomyces rhizoryzae]MCK7626205.1 XRE family transcriptional regulator [Streptomyces rhizoryzae]
MLARSDVRESLEAHDFGRLFYLVRKWAGISYNRIAEACDIKSSRVSELARGEGAITTLTKIEAIADALRIPGAMLRLAPRAWESPPGGTARHAEGATSRRASVLDEARGAEYVEAIRATSRRLIALDNELNGVPIAAMAARAFKAVHRRLGSGGYERKSERDLQAAAAELAEVAGWTLFDAEEYDAARRFNQEALFLARLSGDRAIELLILQNMSMQAGWLGRPREELAIARSLLDRENLSPRIEAIFRVREAKGLFASGQSTEAVRIFRRAQSLIGEGARSDDPPWAWWISTDEINGHRAMELQKAGDWRSAIPLLQENLYTRNRPRVGYQGIYSARLLASLLNEKVWREAGELAESVVSVVPEIGSARTLKLLKRTAAGGEKIAGIPESLRDTLRGVGEAMEKDPYAL